jgi:hypothetical protein
METRSVVDVRIGRRSLVQTARCRLTHVAAMPEAEIELRIIVLALVS